MMVTRNARQTACYVLGMAALLAVTGGRASATTVPFGTAVGGIAIHYNDNGGGENPANVAWVQAQFSVANANGSQYDFDSTPLPGTGGLVSWYGLFQAVPNQFGLDAVVPAPTNDNSNPPPVLTARENLDGNPLNSTSGGQVDWAISGYTGPGTGPGNPADAIVNSLFRGGNGSGATFTITSQSVTHVGTLFTLTVAGEAQSDGLIHWYNPLTLDSPVSNFELTGKLLFQGTLVYDSSTDTSTNLIDFYAGTITVAAEVICGTRYVDDTGSDVLPGPTPNTCRNIGQPCQTVQRTVDLACPGDTVRLGAGSYVEQVTIPKSLTVIGDSAGGSFIRAPGSLPPAGDIVAIQGPATAVDISHVTVAGPGPSGCGSINAGIHVKNGAQGTIHHVTVADVRDQPLSGCQNGRGIRVGDTGLPASAVIHDCTIQGYQKNGIDVRDAASTVNAYANTVSGVGPTAAIAQNGVVVVSATATITGNAIAGNECNHASCGPDPIADTQSCGVLLIDVPTGTTVSGNQIATNDIGVYNASAGTTAISGNQLTGNRYEGIFLDAGNATVSLNQIQGGNIGVAAVSYNGNTANSAGTLSCNRITGAGTGVTLIDETGVDAVIPVLVAHNNAIAGNTAGVVNTTPALMDFETNWWGCVAGPGNVGCDTASANVDFTPVAAGVPSCVTCSTNADCSDGLGCNGTETCNLGTHTCQSGTPLPCSGNQCNTAACVEPGICNMTPKPNGTPCAGTPDTCSLPDTCQAGICTDGGGGDPDADGLCSADDNCPTVANPGQADLDGDGLGNVCDPSDGIINLTQAKLRKSKSLVVGNGVAQLRADLLTDSAHGDVLDASAAITAHAIDNLANSTTFTWAPSDCVNSGTRITCKSADRNAQAKFKQLGSPNLWRVQVKLKHQAWTGPFQGPVAATISYGVGIDRTDSISDCKAASSGLNCREF